MFGSVLKKLFGSHQERALKELWPIVDEINEWYEKFESLSDDEIKAKTDEFRERMMDGETEEDIMVEAFAVVKQACKRNVGQKWTAADMPFEWVEIPYDVQLIGAIVLHGGKIAEMATGEGKTLVAVMPLYLNALSGRGCHLATFNDMLALRDSQWTGRILEWMGLKVGCIQQNMDPPERREQYSYDVTYGQSSEFGFDYLRDNMATSSERLVQGARSYHSQAIADEIIEAVNAMDEARVIMDIFQTVEVELPGAEALPLARKFAERFTMDKIQIRYAADSAEEVGELSKRSADITQSFEDPEVPEDKAHLLFRFVTRDHKYAIVDEVDSLLIDEARTPLIISGQVDRSTHRYEKMRPLVEALAHQQKDLVKKLLDDAQELLEADDDDSRYQAGIRLLQAQKAMPKNKRFMKFKSDPAIDRLIKKCENDFMIDQKSKVGEKSMGYVEEELFFVIDEKGHSVELSDLGRETVSPDDPDRFLLTDLVEKFSEIEGDESLSEEEREEKKAQLRQANEIKTEELHNISQLLRAYTLFEREVEYIVQENKVVIVDEFTGRPQPGRRYSDGLHQAIEAKENVKIEKESQTLATITIQNYFRMYDKLSGMTGTAETEAAEFGHTYQMEVVVIPTNRPITRLDYNDVIYRTRREKYNAIIDETIRLNKQGLPVLLGTVSVEVSELLSRMLKRRGVSHSVLNAKHLQKEAEIVRDAGQMGAITIATNMAGRGTDIKLGKGVLDPPDDIEVDPEQPRGLQIIGSERHESRRIDRQLRGRAGRQGDPGSSQFFLSLEDNLMRLFGSDRISGVLQRLGLEEGEEIQHGFVTKAITRAQKKIESINFEQRKRTLDYDNVMNKQRSSIYGLRRETLIADDLRRLLIDICHDALAAQAASYVNEEQNSSGAHYDLDKFQTYIMTMVPGVDLSDIEPASEPTEEYLESILERVENAYEERRELLGPQLTQELARFVVLQAIDNEWRDHLAAIDELREGIHLRSYAQLDPLIEYQREATYLFQDMMVDIQRLVLEHFFRMNVVAERQQASAVETGRGDLAPVGAEQQQAPADDDGALAQGPRPGAKKPRTFVRDQPKVGRNDPCPCGSGKKYKKCCGR